MSLAKPVEVDYLVAGAGAVGLAFVDTLLTSKPRATVALVDKYVLRLGTPLTTS